MILSGYHWQLPMDSRDNNSTDYIHGNAKVHLFKEGEFFSVCKRWGQVITHFEDVESSLVTQEKCCKICYRKWLNLKNISNYGEVRKNQTI